MVSPNQRGNAILISAIMVFALTVAALGVSRLFINQTRQGMGNRQFLGNQTFEFANAAAIQWSRTNNSPAAVRPLANFNLQGVFPGMPLSKTGTATVTPFVAALNQGLDVTATISDSSVGWIVTRKLRVVLVPDPPTSWRTPGIFDVGGGP